MSYIERLPYQPITRKEMKQIKRELRRAILRGKDGKDKIVHEFYVEEKPVSNKDLNSPKVSTKDIMETWEGETLGMEISYRRRKEKIKKETIARPFGRLGLKLADESEKTVPELRERVEDFAYSYRSGYSPLTGDSLKDIKSYEYYTQKRKDGKVVAIQEKISPQAIDEYALMQEMDAEPAPYGAKRNAVIPNLGVYKMLMDKIFDADFKAKCETAKSDLD